MAGELLLDTGGLVSLLDRSQQRHPAFVRFFNGWNRPVVSTEAVLTEATHLLGRLPGGRQACVDFFLSGGAILVPATATSLLFVPDGGISGSSFGSCIRGANGTTAAAHTSGARIDAVYSANYFNQLKRAIVAIETELGTDPAGASATVDARLDAIETTSATTTTLGVIELATSAEVLTGTDTTRAVVPDTLNDVLTRIPIQGGLINGYISRTVASNNLTVAIKTLAGADPSSSDPVYIRIGHSSYYNVCAICHEKCGYKLDESWLE